MKEVNQLLNISFLPNWFLARWPIPELASTNVVKHTSKPIDERCSVFVALRAMQFLHTNTLKVCIAR